MKSSLHCQFLSPADERWTTLLGRVKHDFYHLPDYVRMCAQMEGGEAGAFHVCENGNELLLPMIVREVPTLAGDTSSGWHDATSPYGYPGPIVDTPGSSPSPAVFTERALAAVLTSMRERRILTSFVRFHPLLPVPSEPFSTLGKLVMHGSTVSIDLSHTLEEIWDAVRRNHRCEIMMLERRPEVRAEEDLNWTHLPDFMSAYLATMERVKAGASYYFDAAYFSKLKQVLGSGLHLMVATIADRFAAGAVVTDCSGLVQYHLAATAPEFFRDRPQKLLCRATWVWAQRKGARFFHLGGGVGGAEDGVFRFKAGFSKLRHPFYTWRACTEPKVYEQMAAMWQKQNPGQSESNFFPAYRRPRTEPPDGTP